MSSKPYHFGKSQQVFEYISSQISADLKACVMCIVHGTNGTYTNLCE